MKRTVRIIGIPMDLGQCHRGVDMGPSAIRYAGLAGALRKIGHTTKDSGDIHIQSHYSLKSTKLDDRTPHIEVGCRLAYEAGKNAIEQGETPIFLGGDHSAAIGSIGGITHNQECGVIWVDAHGDFNTPESSMSKNVHGMALATLMGKGDETLVNVGRKGPKLRGENVVLIGVRDLDPKEKILLKNSGATIYTMRDIDEMGMRKIMEQTFRQFKHLEHIHVSFDLDAMETTEAPGVGTPVPGGLTYREGQLLMESIADTGKLYSLDLMEINPILDIQNKTAQTAVSLSASLFGKTIL